MAYRGIDVREGSDRLIFRASLKDSDGARVVSGTTNLRLGKLHSDGTLLSYDFSDNTFKAGALTTAVVAMTHQTLNNATVNTGLWTYALTTLTGFAAGDVIVAIVENSGALPAEQEREFQFGSGVLAVNDDGAAIPTAEEIDTQLSGTHGAGTYETANVSGLALEATVAAVGVNVDTLIAGVNVTEVNGKATINGDSILTVLKKILAPLGGTCTTDTSSAAQTVHTFLLGATQISVHTVKTDGSRTVV